MMKRLMFLFGAFLVAHLAFAQFSLQGIISNDKGEPLPGAVVQVDGSLKTSANESGLYRIDGVTNGDHQIITSYIGYKTDTAKVKMQNDLRINITLVPVSYAAEEVRVYATRASNTTPVAFSNVSEKQIAERNFGQDLPYLIGLSPSVVTTSDAGTGVGYTSFRIRGTDVNRINVTMNDVPLNDAESHGVWWVNMPDLASSVDNIQIQRGVGTSTNGAGAFGGSVNIQSNNLKHDSYAEVSSSAGTFNTFKNTVKVGTGLLNNHYAFDARLSKITSDGYIDRGWSDLKSFYVSGGYYAKNTIVRVNVFSGKERTYQAWNGIDPLAMDTVRTSNSCGAYYDFNGNLKYYDNETDNYQQDHYQLHLNQKLGEFVKFNASLHYTYGRGYYEEYKDDTAFGKYGLDNIAIGDTTIKTTDLTRQKWLDNDFYGFTTSLVYKNDKLELIGGGGWNQYDGRHFGKILWLENNFEIPNNYEWYRSTGLKTDYNIYGKINYSLSPVFNIFGDMQYRHIEHKIAGIDDEYYDLDYDGENYTSRDITQNHSFDFYNPKFGVFAKLNDHHLAYASFAVANREPNRSNYVDADPGKVPTSERLNDIELGYQVNINKNLFGVNLYYMDYKNQLVQTGQLNDVGAAMMANVDKSYRMGVEFTASLVPVSILKWDINATLSKNRIEKYTQQMDEYDINWNYIGQKSVDYKNTDISFSPDLIANSIITVKPSEYFNVQFISQYVGEQFIDNTSSDKSKLDSYFVNNLKFNIELKPKVVESVAFSLLVNNIFDHMYESNAWSYQSMIAGETNYMLGLYPQAGVNVLAGVTVRF